MEHNHVLAEKIKAARVAAGMSQQQLADALGINLRTAGNWERTGAVPALRVANLRQVLPGLNAEQEAQGWTAGPVNGGHLHYAKAVPVPLEESPVAQLKRLRRELARITMELDDCLERLEQS